MRAAFLRAESDGDTTGCFVLDVVGGEAQQVLDGTITVGACRRSPPGGRRAFLAREPGNGAGEGGWTGPGAKVPHARRGDG